MQKQPKPPAVPPERPTSTKDEMLASIPLKVNMEDVFRLLQERDSEILQARSTTRILREQVERLLFENEKLKGEIDELRRDAK